MVCGVDGVGFGLLGGLDDAAVVVTGAADGGEDDVAVGGAGDEDEQAVTQTVSMSTARIVRISGYSTQSNVRVTAFFHCRNCFSTCSGGAAGSQVRSARQFLMISLGSSQNPTASPAA